MADSFEQWYDDLCQSAARIERVKIEDISQSNLRTLYDATKSLPSLCASTFRATSLSNIVLSPDGAKANTYVESMTKLIDEDPSKLDILEETDGQIIERSLWGIFSLLPLEKQDLENVMYAARFKFDQLSSRLDHPPRQLFSDEVNSSLFASLSQRSPLPEEILTLANIQRQRLKTGSDKLFFGLYNVFGNRLAEVEGSLLAEVPDLYSMQTNSEAYQDLTTFILGYALDSWVAASQDLLQLDPPLDDMLVSEYRKVHYKIGHELIEQIPREDLEIFIRVKVEIGHQHDEIFYEGCKVAIENGTVGAWAQHILDQLEEPVIGGGNYREAASEIARTQSIIKMR